MVSAEDGLWKEYATAARIADNDRDEVTTERAWRTAATLAEKLRDDDPRKALSFAWWGLALTRTGSTTQATNALKRAEELLAKVDPPATPSAPERRRAPDVIEARGAWAWGAGRNSTEPFSMQRATWFELAIDSLAGTPLAPIRRAELFSESARQQRNCGKLMLAERHAQAALRTLDREKFEDATVAEALIAAALMNLEAGHADLAQASIIRAIEFAKKLSDLPADRRPNGAALWTVALRVATARRDRDAGDEATGRLGIGSDRELLAGDHPLISPFDLLSAAVEWDLLSPEKDVGPALQRLKTLTGTDGNRRGRVLILQGFDEQRNDRLREALQRFSEGITALESALGKSHPRLIPPLAEVAVLQAIVGQDPAATSSARRGVEIASDLPVAHTLRADAMAALARVELLQQHAGEAARLAATGLDLALVSRPSGDPAIDALRALAADAEAQAGNFTTARNHLARLESVSFDSLPAFQRLLLHWNIGHAAHLSGDLGTARSHYAQSLRAGGECRPASAEPHSLSAWPRLALDAIEGAVPPGPGFAITWKLLLRLKRTDEEAALELTRQANACFSASRHGEAIWLYDRSIDAYSRMGGDHGATITRIKKYRDRAKERLETASKS